MSLPRAFSCLAARVGHGLAGRFVETHGFQARNRAFLQPHQEMLAFRALCDDGERAAHLGRGASEKAARFATGGLGDNV